MNSWRSVNRLAQTLSWSLTAAMVLLKNDNNTLPLDKNKLVIGFDAGYGIALNSLGDVYAAGTYSGAGSKDAHCLSLTSAGVSNWSYTVTDAGGDDITWDVTVDSSDDLPWLTNQQNMCLSMGDCGIEENYLEQLGYEHKDIEGPIGQEELEGEE